MNVHGPLPADGTGPPGTSVVGPPVVDRGSVSPRIRIGNVSKRFRTHRTQVVALDDVSFDVGPGELVVLLGPSGCGKTTLLRCVAGLEHADAGTIEIDGKVVFSADRRVNLPPEERHLSMVFQSYALWPHMSVFDNVAYPLRNRRTPEAEIRDRVMNALTMVGCGDLHNRSPGQLSGGQQQRVSLARAIVSNAGVILFDEPLSNVDAKVREQLRLELLAMQRDLGFSALYVTHDQVEATALAHRIVVMRAGTVAQIGTPREVYEQPRSRYVADFIGAANELSGVVEQATPDLVRVKTEIGPVLAAPGPNQTSTGQRVAVLFRPEHLKLRRPGAGAGPNCWRAQLQRTLFLGAYLEYVVAVGRLRLLSRTMEPYPLQDGEDVEASIDPDRVRVLPEE